HEGKEQQKESAATFGPRHILKGIDCLGHV
ncbi:MAG: hypothetical protein ACI93G_001247, partial [Hyphomonas sp.]